MENLFIDLCIEEVNTRERKGSSLDVKSLDIIGSKIKELEGRGFVSKVVEKPLGLFEDELYNMDQSS